jgi:hypothetical protein
MMQPVELLCDIAHCYANEEQTTAHQYVTNTHTCAAGSKHSCLEDKE